MREESDKETSNREGRAAYLTLVNIGGAKLVSEPRQTLTGEVGNVVMAGGIVLARPTLTLVNVNITVGPGEARLTDALITIDAGDASTVVAAGVGEALVNLQVTVVAGEAGEAVALVGAVGVLTDAVDAGLLHHALVHVFLTVVAWGRREWIR